MKDYFELINSQKFKNSLKDLNSSIIQNLKNKILLGNLFYDHEQENFYESDLLKDCEEKRIRLYQAAKKSKSMIEIGVNGGHSSFLCLNANENLSVIGNDIAEFYPGCPKCHPEIYVPEAFKFLETTFENRFKSLKGNCLKVIPEFVKENPDKKFDLVHIDGNDETYEQDFFNLIPVLEDKALVIFDDSNIPFIQSLINDLIQKNYLKRIDEFPQMKENVKYRNEILEYISESDRKKMLFENIYKNNIWNEKMTHIPRSGPGSSLECTESFRSFLNIFIDKNELKSVVDLGCGDLTWIKYTKAFMLDYTGIDITKSLIEEHKINYPTKKFYNKDIVKDEIPECDLIIIRDVIFHMKVKDIMDLFENIKGKFKYLTITSCNNLYNEDYHNNIYHFSSVNLEIYPFNKNKGLIVADESHSNRKILLFSHDTFFN